MQIDPSELKPKETPIDLVRIPERKDESGWRGPGVLLNLDLDEGTAIVKMQGYPYSVPIRHIRKHLAHMIFVLFQYYWQANWSQTLFYEEHHGDQRVRLF